MGLIGTVVVVVIVVMVTIAVLPLLLAALLRIGKWCLPIFVFIAALHVAAFLIVEFSEFIGRHYGPAAKEDCLDYIVATIVNCGHHRDRICCLGRGCLRRF